MGGRKTGNLQGGSPVSFVMSQDRNHEREPGAEIAYNAIAPAYDSFTAHHNHSLWLDRFLPKLVVYGIEGKRLLDVACGTGKSFIPMLELGWEVTACDISPAMIAIAREKAGDSATISVADMRDLPTFGEFDLVLCLGEALNYLLSTQELEEALRGMRRNLRLGGCLMFDVNALGTYRTFFSEEVVIEQDGNRMRWKGRTGSDLRSGEIAEATFESKPVEELLGMSIAPEIHRERHFPEVVIRRALEAADFECLAVYGHDHDTIPEQPLDDFAHMKGVYIARAV
jgi:ubiquinone/menaquinone biosynthesis C-methylase UbiE